MAMATPLQITQNQHFARLLGWTPADFGATAFDGLLVAAIEAQQALLNLHVDGIAGPITYGKLLATIQDHLRAHPTTDRLADAGRIALCEAKRRWLTNIADLPAQGTPDYERDRLAIDQMIRTPLGLNWDWEPPYHRTFQWCGAAASSWWRAAGLKLALRRTFFASTYRLDRWARYQPFDPTTPNPRPPTGPYRMILDLTERSTPKDLEMPDGTPVRAGDLVLVGMVDTAYGTHITVAERVDAATGVITTIEGNGTGASPTGVRQHGVVRATRPVGLGAAQPPTTYHVRRVIRPALADLVLA